MRQSIRLCELADSITDCPLSKGHNWPQFLESSSEKGHTFVSESINECQSGPAWLAALPTYTALPRVSLPFPASHNISNVIISTTLRE